MATPPATMRDRPRMNEKPLCRTGAGACCLQPSSNVDDWHQLPNIIPDQFQREELAAIVAARGMPTRTADDAWAQPVLGRSLAERARNPTPHLAQTPYSDTTPHLPVGRYGHALRPRINAGLILWFLANLSTHSAGSPGSDGASM